MSGRRSGRAAAGASSSAVGAGDPELARARIDQECDEIAAAADQLRTRLVMGRYAGFAAGFDAGLAVCGMLEALGRDRGRSPDLRALRAQGLSVARHINRDPGHDDDPIRG